MSLADALEKAAGALAADADAIRPANGDPDRLLAGLSPEAAARVATWLLANEPDEGAELVEAWAGQPVGAEVLLAMDESGLPKSGRKVLRRVRHRLRSRGVIAPAAEVAPRVARLPTVEDALSAAFVSPIDPGGRRIVYLMESNPSGGARLFEVVLDEAQGIVAFDLYTAGRRNARAFLKELTSRERFAAVEAPPEAARAVVARALAAQAPDRPPPKSFVEWRSHVAEVPPGTALPGELAVQALGEKAGAEQVADAAARIAEGRLGPWPPPNAKLAELFERIRTALDSPVIVSGATRAQQLDDLLADAVEDVFDAPGTQRVVHQLRESAFVYWRSDDEEAALACLAAAGSLEEGSLRDNPVARALVETPLRPALESIERKSEQGAAVEDETQLVQPLAKPR